MSTTPVKLYEVAHVSGTTWAGFALDWVSAASPDAVPEPIDFTGSDAQLIFYDQNNQVVFDWRVSDPSKPGIRWDDDPRTGRLYIDGPGIITAAADTLRGVLKIWHQATGEVFIDVEIVLPIEELP